MTADRLWPNEAREAVARVVDVLPYSTPVGSVAPGLVDAVLATLSVHVVPRAAVLDLANRMDPPGVTYEEDAQETQAYVAAWADRLRALAGGNQ